MSTENHTLVTQTTEVEVSKTIHLSKRIVVCCDGTWQDGLIVDKRWKYTNVMRLARAITHVDTRSDKPVLQVVFYQSGVGTFGDKVIEELDGIVGASLGEKVQETYGFIAQNYAPGDEIFLFGFSRGAYTARMVADLIGAIGVLDRKDMDAFADIFLAYQKRGKTQNKAEIEALDKQLAPWTSHDSAGKLRAYSDDHTFSVKCVGVFDTVGAVGLPEELTLSDKVKTLFGFHDLYLGTHVEQGYQALAIDEHRADFNCAKWSQTEAGRRKGQILKQCWFSGCHSDIGGGFQDHDLSDLTLTWMVANVEGILSLDMDYLKSLPDPYAPWGALPPHNSITGIYVIGNTIQRAIPTETNDVTHEYIHPSVLRQDKLNPDVVRAVKTNASIVWDLLPLEQFVKDAWKIIRARSTVTKESEKGENKVTHIESETTTVSANVAQQRKQYLVRYMKESSVASLIKEVVGALD